MFKKLFKTVYLMSVLVIGIYLTKQVIVILESEDDIDTAPKDFASESDQYDINGIKGEGE